MEKLYESEPYRKEFTARVVSCVPGNKYPYEVILDRTAFYPEGGGQPWDMGVLGTVQVLETHEKNGQVIHYVDGALKEGSEVEGRIDWDRRYSNMQHHSGEHIFSGLVHRHFGYDNVGFHMGQDEVTVDFNGPLTPEEVWKVEVETNRLIYDNVPVNISYPDPETLHTLDYRSKKELTGKIRIVEIPGGDCCACCGTHVGTTGEIGILKIVSMMNYKGGVRLGLLCGERALLDYEKKREMTAKISALLSAKPERIVEAVEKLKADSGAKDGKVSSLSQKLLKFKAEQMPESGEPLLVIEEGLEPVQVRQYCDLLSRQGKGSVVLVCSGEGENWRYVLGSETVDVRPANRTLTGLLNGRGGGSAQMTQGTFSASKEEIRMAFHQLEWKE